MIETIDQLPIFVRMVISLIIVIALMGGLAMIIKHLGLANVAALAQGQQSRLSVLERHPLDPRRQLVLIQRDDQQHLVILGVDGETVIETNIKTVKSKNAAKPKKLAQPKSSAPPTKDKAS